MDHDTDHPDGRPEVRAVPPPGPARMPPSGTAILPTHRGADLEIGWIVLPEPGARVLVNIDFSTGGGLAATLGDPKLVAAALRSLARDLEAAPAWTADAPIAPRGRAA